MLAGQFKVPSFLQQLTSSGNQSFVDRSIVSDEFARGRDTGFAVQGVLFSNKLEYRAGIFNGNGLTRTINDNASFQTNARLMWQPNGNQVLVQRAWVSGALYSEADFESTTRAALCVRAELRAQRLPRDDHGRRPEVGHRRRGRHLQIQGRVRDGRLLLAGADARDRREVQRRRLVLPDRRHAQPPPHLGGGDPLRRPRGEQQARQRRHHRAARRDQLLLPPPHAQVPDGRRAGRNGAGRDEQTTRASSPKCGYRRSSSSEQLEGREP